MTHWYYVVSDPAVLRRAVITGVGVGTLLTAINHGPDLLNGTLPASAPVQIALSYAIPFLVSLASSVIAIRVERRDSTAATDLLEREIDAIERFPGRNPNPVLRMTPDGALWYGNAASAPIRRALGVDIGDPLPPPLLDELAASLASPDGPAVEVAGEGRTFRLTPVRIPEFDF